MQDTEHFIVSPALTGTNDFGEIIERAFPSDADSSDSTKVENRDSALLAYNLYLDRLLGYVKSYAAAVLGSPAPSNHLDGLIFSGGIGEHSSRIREDVVRAFAWIEQLAATDGGLDPDANNQSEGLRCITKEGSKVPAYVVETDEELEAVQLAIKASGSEKQ